MLAQLHGTIVSFVDEEGRMDMSVRRLNRLSKGLIKRYSESAAFKKLKAGDAITFYAPHGLAVERLVLVKVAKNSTANTMREIGAGLHAYIGAGDVHLVTTGVKFCAHLAFGVVLRHYRFESHKTAKDAPQVETVTIWAKNPDSPRGNYKSLSAVAEGVYFTRDLVNEPANILTTTEFADRLLDLRGLGLKLSVLEEAQMQKLGMNALLGVGQGSKSPSKIVVMEWNGGGDEAPLALIGKGVVFDTGGISLKPAGGMEDMTMDMGGAGVVAGVMKTLALRKAKANVIGLVGLVENMPDALAQRPGDVVRSMKGDTIEVINTDAEGRLVLADVMWYAQETFNPCAMIDLATLTGAIIIGLGHDNAGVFSNDDRFVGQLLSAAKAEGEGAWHMPLGASYDKQLKSRIADMKNVGTRAAGSITAAQFLQRFVKDDTPWIHLDIAGVASVKSATTYAPAGATGWGVMTLNRLIEDTFAS